VLGEALTTREPIGSGFESDVDSDGRYIMTASKSPAIDSIGSVTEGRRAQERVVGLRVPNGVFYHDFNEKCFIGVIVLDGPINEAIGGEEAVE
jgi:hypothetical protein